MKLAGGEVESKVGFGSRLLRRKKKKKRGRPWASLGWPGGGKKGGKGAFIRFAEDWV